MVPAVSTLNSNTMVPKVPAVPKVNEFIQIIMHETIFTNFSMGNKPNYWLIETDLLHLIVVFNQLNPHKRFNRYQFITGTRGTKLSKYY